MFSDLFHSKNAPAAMILVVVGILMAVLLPTVLPFPGWAAGMIGLLMGGFAGVLAMQGIGANRDDLLAIRAGIMSAVRGERATRPAEVSPELSQVFAATDELAAQVDGQRQRHRETESVLNGLRGELARRADGLVQGDDELLRAIDALTAGVAEQLGSIERIAETLVNMRAAVDELMRDSVHGARLSEQLASDTEHAAETLGRDLRELVERPPQAANAADPRASLADGVATVQARLGALEDVVEQGELLALNAEIKAAQAGDAGKGFGVVADDIRELVERLALTIRELGTLTTKTTATTPSERLARGAEIVNDVDRSTVDRQGRLTVGIERALKKLVDGGRHGGEGAAKVARGVAEQARRSENAADEAAVRLDKLRDAVRDHERRIAELRTVSQRLHRLTQDGDR